MIRVGADVSAMKHVLAGIKESAPESIILFDIHGSTVKGEDGIKVRSVETTVKHVKLLAGECAEQGLQLHGLHVETTGDSTRRECVEKAEQRPDPSMKPDVDPLFNPEQFQSILSQTKQYLPGGDIAQ